MGPREKEVNEVVGLVNEALVGMSAMPVQSPGARRRMEESSNATMLMSIAKSLAVIADILEGKYASNVSDINEDN